jgi:hypothetical protein
MPLNAGGFGGSYVCEGCSEPVAGVYRVIRPVQRRESWLCAACRAATNGKNVSEANQAGKGLDVLQARPALHGMA